jgi:putative hydrolase of the HAD superfamily
MLTYKKINAEMWSQYRYGDVSKEDLRYGRFLKTLATFGCYDKNLCFELADYYVAHSPRKNSLTDGAGETLLYLSAKYHLHIITNGFQEIQNIKLENSGIKIYFKKIITSEQIGVRKPDIAIFNYALKEAGASAKESVMVGDSLEVDIIGAKQAGMHQVFYNPFSEKHKEEITCEIKNLKELIHLL